MKPAFLTNIRSLPVRILSIITCAVCTLLFAVTPTLRCAYAADDVSSVIDGVIAVACDGASVQQWVDSTLAPEAGGAGDYYILALNHLGFDYDTASYARALTDALEQGCVSNPVSRLRAILTLISCGGRSRVTAEMVDGAVGEMGVMSYVYGLHLCNSGAPSALWNADKLVDRLIELRLSDGGWAVSGGSSDVDVTAMCLQALACYDGATDVSPYIEASLDFLSSAQKPDGGFSSYGTENCESACQVLIALNSLGVDPYADPRFIKNGISIPENILSYRLMGGAFSHAVGGDANATASMQALLAFATTLNPSPLYALSAAPERSFSASAAQNLMEWMGWKFWGYAAVLVVAIMGCALALLKKHGRGKRLMGVALICALLAVAVTALDIRSTAEYYSAETVADPMGRVTLSIRCDTVAGRSSNGTTPEDGVILSECDIPFAQDETVLDVLLRAAKEHRIQIEHSGAAAGMAYVNSIANLYEYDFGPQSGWMFSVNGAFPSVGCDGYALSDGDAVLWQYTLANGEDLK